MRTDFTLLHADGSSQDIAVIAPDGATFAELTQCCPLLAAVELADGVRISGDHRFGRLPLCDGAVLTPAALGHSPTGITAQVTAGAAVEVVGGTACGAAAELSRAPLVVGRAADCDLVLGDPRVSRRHLEWRATPSGAWVRDLGSTHGSTIDGRPLLGATRVDESSVVRAGDTVLQLRRAATPADPTGPERTVVESAPRRAGSPGGTRRRVRWAVLAPALVTLAASAVAAAVLHAPELVAISGVSAAASLAVQASSLRHRPADSDIEPQPPARRAGGHEREVAARPVPCDPAALVRRAYGLRGRPWAPPPDDGAGDAAVVRIGWAEPASEPVAGARAVPLGEPMGNATVTLEVDPGTITVDAPEPVARGVLRWLVMQLSVRRPPGALVVRLDSDRPEEWHWMRWLPHFRRQADSPVGSSYTLTVLDRRRRIALVVAKPAASPGPVTALTASDGRSSLLRCGDRLVIADCATPALAEQLARALVGRPVPASGAPARECRLLDLLAIPVSSVAALRAHWAGHGSTARLVVGLTDTGPFELDLDRDGPHLLVAGTTGSGKSEFLQTLVAALAVELPPSELTFLFIDYKGGAALRRCAQLPHCVGLVSDLDPPLARRLVRSLGHELRRREAVLDAAAVPDRAALRRAGSAAMPRLVVVVDEFAVLADEAADTVAGLVGIARRGRSLGIHLVLATQRPGGTVSSEIRANTGIQVAFRTITASDSADVVGVADAARLHPGAPGRAVVRTPGGVTVMQSARVAGAGAVAERRPRVVPLGPWRELAGPAPPPHGDDLDAVLTAANAAARRLSQCRPRRPWLAPLPAVLTGGTPGLPAGALGSVELLAEQRRTPLLLPDRGTCWLVTGRAGSGRSSAAVAAVLAAARSRPAVHAHVIADTSDRSPWRAVLGLPAVGTVVDRDDIDLVARLAAILDQELAAAPHPQSRSARCLLVVDGCDQIALTSGELDGGRTAADLLGMTQAVRASGGIAVLTATRPTNALTALADERFLLTPLDPSDYLAAGLPRGHLPAAVVPGRAVRASDGAEIQFVLPESAAADATLLGNRPGQRAPVLVRQLPSRVAPAPQAASAAGWLLGVVGDLAGELYVDPAALGLQMLVTGPPRSGLTSVLAGMLAQCGPGTALVAAGRRSVLPAAAATSAMLLTRPPTAGGAALADAPEDAVLLVDDAEFLDDAPLADAVSRWLRDGRPAVLAAHTDAVGAAFRGPLAALRRAGCGALLRPGPGDGELLGVSSRGAIRIPRRPGPPGRGVLVPGSSRLPVPDVVAAQLVTCDAGGRPPPAQITACADTCGPTAERTSP